MTFESNDLNSTASVSDWLKNALLFFSNEKRIFKPVTLTLFPALTFAKFANSDWFIAVFVPWITQLAVCFWRHENYEQRLYLTRRYSKSYSAHSFLLYEDGLN